MEENEKLIEFEHFIDGKKVAILGMGVSNTPLLDYFYNKNAKVTIFDKNVLSDDIMQKINEYRYEVEIGEDNLTRLNGFDIIFRSPSMLPTREEFKREIERGTILTSEIEMVIKLAPCKVIGVTGTEGKTTTTTIIYEILKNAGYNCFLGGNIGKPIFTKLKDMKKDDIVVLELSSFQLMGMEVSPSISIVTNMYPDHLNIHSSYEEYQDAKKTIFKNQDENGIVILNNDNEITKQFANEVKGNKVFFSSREKLLNGYIYDRDEEVIKKCVNGKEINLISKYDIKLRGIHNYENICTALAATDTLVDSNKQIETIKNFTGVEHRLEYVKTIDDVKYYNDSIGTSPASTIAGLDAFDENIVLIAGGSDKGLDYKEIGEKIADKVGTLILTGPTSEKIENATKIALMNKEDKNIDIIHCSNLEEAVKMAKIKSIKGDIVLMSPASASFDAFKNFEERGKKFKEYVNSL